MMIRALAASTFLAIALAIPVQDAAAQDPVGSAILGGAAGAILGGAMGGGRGAAVGRWQGRCEIHLAPIFLIHCFGSSR